MPQFVVQFSGQLLVGQLQTQLVQTNIPATGDVVFDLADVTFIESTTLVLFLALISKYEGEGRKLIFNFPRSKRVRDFLRSWRFPVAVEKVSADHSLRRVTTAQTHQYFGENELPGASKSFAAKRTAASASRIVEEEGATFWPFQIYECGAVPFNDSLALHECDFWSGPFMQQILKRHLRAEPEHVPRDIVFEAMANAVRHPGASCIFTVSHLARTRTFSDGVCVSGQSEPAPHVVRTPSHFTTSWWDNGKSIIDTLREPLMAGAPVRSIVTPKGISFDQYVYDENEVLLYHRIVDESVNLSESTEQESILLAAVLPGVTRDPSVAAAALPTDRTVAERGIQPGMGLYFLLNAAVDVYGGKVSFRTKNLFLNISAEAGRPAGRYKAKMILYHERNAIPGNMLTIRLPLRSARQARTKVEVFVPTIAN